MDFPWTDPTTIPEKLYRVIYPDQNTHYDPENGLLAAVNLPSHWFIDSTNLPVFHHSIRSHRDQVNMNSPYISLFESLDEAEMFCIAASDFHKDVNGDTCFIIEIDTTGREFRKSVRPRLWFVHDIQVMCPEGVQLGEGPKEGLIKGEKGGRFDSEWLCLYAIPGGRNMKVLKGSKECRVDQDWQGENDLAFTGPMRLRGGVAAKDWLRLEPTIDVWEQCKVCFGANGCQHGGGFDELRSGTMLSQRIREDVPEKLSKVLSRPAKDARDDFLSKRKELVADERGQSMKFGGDSKGDGPDGRPKKSGGSFQSSTAGSTPSGVSERTSRKENTKK